MFGFLSIMCYAGVREPSSQTRLCLKLFKKHVDVAFHWTNLGNLKCRDICVMEQHKNTQNISSSLELLEWGMWCRERAFDVIASLRV